MLTDTLADLKPRKPLIASMDISLADAIKQMQDINVGLMALVDQEGRLAGVFTEGDVFKKVACQVDDLDQAQVRDYMTQSVTTLKSDTTIAFAMQMMGLHRFRHVMIVDEEGKPEGVLSFRAVVTYIEQVYTSNE
ncbi:MAG: CBS domain-containing protein [Chloroflexota bacterium]